MVWRRGPWPLALPPPTILSTPRPPPIDDISPGSDQIARWAKAGSRRSGAIAPDDASRPASATAACLVSGSWSPAARRPRPFWGCPRRLACFDADRADGRDGYCRAGWLLAERCVCPTHPRMLIDQCPNCHRPPSGRVPAARRSARPPVCARCEGGLDGRGGEGDGSMRDFLATALLAMQARIAAAVDQAPTDRNSLEETHRRPVGACSTIPARRARCWRFGCPSEAGGPPVEARLAVGRPMPLGSLRVPFRGRPSSPFATSSAMRSRRSKGRGERTDWLFRRATFPRPAPSQMLWACGVLGEGGATLSPNNDFEAGNSRACRLGSGGRRWPASRTPARNSINPAPACLSNSARPKVRPGLAIRHEDGPPGREAVQRLTANLRLVVERENRRLGRSSAGLSSRETRATASGVPAPFKSRPIRQTLSDMPTARQAGRITYNLKELTKRRFTRDLIIGK